MSLTRPKLNLKQAYERVKSALTGVKSDVATLEPIAKNTQGNGIYNGKMPINQKAAITSPTVFVSNDYRIDMWRGTAGGVTGTIQQIIDGYAEGVNSIKLVATSTASGTIRLYQTIESYINYVDRTITFSALVKSNSSDARLLLNTSAGWITLDAHSGGGAWELLSGTVSIDTGITALSCFVGIDGVDSANVSITSGDYIELTDVCLDLGSHRLSGDREYGEEVGIIGGSLI